MAEGRTGAQDLVTGGTGIVGAHLLVALAQRGRRVRALIRPGSDMGTVRRIFAHYGDRDGTLFDRIEQVPGDLLDIASLQDAMREVERVYHAAALVSFDPRDSAALRRMNVDGTRNVVDACLLTGVRLLGHVSSTATMGRTTDPGPITEEVTWQQTRSTSPYSSSKYHAEMEVERGRAEGLEAVIVNPCVVLGPGTSGRSSMGLVERIARGTRFYPPGSNAVVDARDVAEALIGSCEKGLTTGRYLLVGENITYKDLFQRMAQALGSRKPDLPVGPWILRTASFLEGLRSFLTGSRALVTRYTVDSALTTRSYSAEALQRALGMEFRSAEESISNLAEWSTSSGISGAPPSSGPTR